MARVFSKDPPPLPEWSEIQVDPDEQAASSEFIEKFRQANQIKQS